MEWVKKHTDTVIVLGAIFSGFLWINGKFNDLDRRMSELQNRLVRIETILYVKGLIQHELAAKSLLDKE